GTIKVWEPDVSTAWKCARIIPIAAPEVGGRAGAETWMSNIWLAITPDGKHVAACSKGSSMVSMFALADGSRIAAYMEVGSRLCGMAVSAESHLVAAGYDSKETDLGVVSASMVCLLGSSLGQGPLLAAGPFIPAIARARDGILVWDLDSREVKQRLAPGL